MTGRDKRLKNLPKEASSDGAWTIASCTYSNQDTKEVEYIHYQRFRSDIEKPIALLPYEAVFIIKFNYPTNVGLFDEQDEPALYALEELLVEELEKTQLGSLFCVHTFMGDREYVFYTQIDVSDRVDEILAKAPADYKIHFESNFDPEWKDLFNVKKQYQPVDDCS